MVAGLLDLGQIAFCRCYFPGIAVFRGELTMILFPVSFFSRSLFSYSILCQQSPIPSVYHVFHSSSCPLLGHA